MTCCAKGCRLHGCEVPGRVCCKDCPTEAERRGQRLDAIYGEAATLFSGLRLDRLLLWALRDVAARALLRGADALSAMAGKVEP